MGYFFDFNSKPEISCAAQPRLSPLSGMIPIQPMPQSSISLPLLVHP